MTEITIDEVIALNNIVSIIPEDMKARLMQCVTCKHDPAECRCDESDEDADGMCKRYEQRKEE